MKLKSTLFLLLSLGSFSLHADWVATEVISRDADEPMHIASALEYEYASLRNFLSGMNFVFPHKMVLTQLNGRQELMGWENDENCQIPNPETVEKFILTNVDFDYYLTDKPDEISHGFIHQWFMSTPCQNSSSKPQIKRTISFNNKLETTYISQ